MPAAAVERQTRQRHEGPHGAKPDKADDADLEGHDAQPGRREERRRHTPEQGGRREGIRRVQVQVEPATVQDALEALGRRPAARERPVELHQPRAHVDQADEGPDEPQGQQGGPPGRLVLDAPAIGRAHGVPQRVDGEEAGGRAHGQKSGEPHHVVEVVDLALVHGQTDDVQRHHRRQAKRPASAESDGPQEDQGHVGDRQGPRERRAREHLEREQRVERHGAPHRAGESGQDPQAPAEDVQGDRERPADEEHDPEDREVERPAPVVGQDRVGPEPPRHPPGGRRRRGGRTGGRGGALARRRHRPRGRRFDARPVHHCSPSRCRDLPAERRRAPTSLAAHGGTRCAFNRSATLRWRHSADFPAVAPRV